MSDDVSNLVKQILAEAEETARATLSRASRAAEREVQAAREEVTGAAARERGTQDARKEAEKKRLIGTARMEGRRRVERLRHDLVDAVLADVESRLRELREAAAYPAALEALCTQTAAELAATGGVLLIDSEDYARLEPALREELCSRIAHETGASVGPGEEGWGGGLVGKAGRLEVDNRLPQRLSRLGVELGPRIAEVLFGK